MPDNIVTNTTDVNLTAVAATIRTELQCEAKAGAALLRHAMAAGDALNLAQANLHKTHLTWKEWLRLNCFVSTRTAEVRQQLARHRGEIETEVQRRGDHFSIRAALRKITKNKNTSAKKPKPQTDQSPLAKSAWAKATVDERRRFLDGIGVDSILGAISTAFRAELKRRVAGQQAAMASALSDIIVHGIRQALSCQKAAKQKDAPAPGVASALGFVNNKLEAAGLDLNNITSVNIDPAATQRRAA